MIPVTHVGVSLLLIFLCVPIPFRVVFLLILWYLGITSSDVFLQRSFLSGRHSLTRNAHGGALSNTDEFTHHGLASEAVHILVYA